MFIGGAKVYNLGGLKGEGAYLTDHSLTLHLFFGSAPPKTRKYLGGSAPPKPVIRAAYVNVLNIEAISNNAIYVSTITLTAA